MKYWFVPLLCGTLALNAGEFQISGFHRVGVVQAHHFITRLDQAFTNGIVTLERADQMDAGAAQWTPLKSFYSLGPQTGTIIPTAGDIGFFRARQVDLSGGLVGFTNFVRSYSIITTIAGAGQWFYHNPDYAKVSEIRAVALDASGNILITEHDAGYIRRIRFLPHDP